MPADGNGRKTTLQFYHPPKRVVSLVPSITESLFELGFGETVVGITDYCTHPAHELEGLPRLGGPKNPRTEEIIALQPELVLANWEENTRPAVEALEDAGIFVWVTFPKNVRQALDVLWTLVGLYNSREAAIRLEVLEMTFEWAKSAAADRQPVRYFCPIWRDTTSAGQAWWMAFNQECYTHDLLANLGGENVFGGRQRRYPLDADLGLAEAQDPGERDTRYPRVTSEEIRAANPQVIILPNEPFEFDEQHQQEIKILLPDCDAVNLVDGSLLTWHGTRLALALRELPALFNPK
jgi:ABC-type Fe3+-hydroxamate transport system substrate-binding protein